MALAGGAGWFASCRQAENPASSGAGATPKADYSSEEYVWISPHANLPLYKAHDHPALELAAKELGVKGHHHRSQHARHVGLRQHD
jgi:hypothetical protein